MNRKHFRDSGDIGLTALQANCQVNTDPSVMISPKERELLRERERVTEPEGAKQEREGEIVRTVIFMLEKSI